MDVYLIWSNEHRAWWGPGRSGYVKRVADAGRYSQIEALKICVETSLTELICGEPPELPVRLEDLVCMVEAWRLTYPPRAKENA